MNYTRYLLLLFGVMALASCRQEKLDVTFSSLLEEMVDYEEAARFPALPFSCRQESSYDRRSIHPDSAGWFANNDGFGIIRVDTVNGRKENVLFDQDGPGVITRFWLTTMDNKVINCCCHLVCVGAISCVLFFGGNYWFADSASTHEEEVMVQKKYIETHKKTRRVGRHRYVSDGVRKEYYLQVAFENGNVETLHVSPSTYNKTKTGRPKILTLQKGLFGLPVITKGL